MQINAQARLEEYYKSYDEYLAVYSQLAGIPEEKLSLQTRQLRASVDTKFNNTKLLIALLDPWFFILNYGYTQDERDYENPFKPFIGKYQQPEDYKYLKDITKIWVSYPRIIVPKSRQLMITWLFCHLYLWDALTNVGKRNGMQTKNEEAAKQLIDRVEVIINHLPPELKPRIRRTDDPPRIRILDTKSEVWGLPQGPDVARSHTFSNYLIDEAWLQDDLEETYLAAHPASVRLALVCSTPKNLNRSAVFFNSVADDEYGTENISEDVPHGEIPGYTIDVRRNRNSFIRAGAFFWHVPHRWLIKEEDGKITRSWVTTEEWEKEHSKGYSEIAWRREQCGETVGSLGERIFERDVMEMVRRDIIPPLAIGKLIINEVGEIKFVNDATGPLKIFEWPIKEEILGKRIIQPSRQYACGVDTGAGLNLGDYSVAAVGDKKTGKVVAVWRSRRKPITFAHELYMLLKFYNSAFVVPEANSYGFSMIEELMTGCPERKIAPYDNIYRPKLEGWKESPTRVGLFTNWQNKWSLLEQCAQGVRDRKLIITAKEIADEMEHYIRFEDETLGAAKGRDDCVSAIALLYRGLKDSFLVEEPSLPGDEEDDWDWDGPFAERHTETKKYCDVTGY